MAFPDLCSTTMWVRFFTESGIPHSVAANYAVTFVDNRITRNMLLDLNKEILQDMGVNVMGDVIAILKHAKVVHAQMTRDKVYQSEPSVASVPPVAMPGHHRKALTMEKNVIRPVELSGKIQASPTALTSKKTTHKWNFADDESPVKKQRLSQDVSGRATLKTVKSAAQQPAGEKRCVFKRLGGSESSAKVVTTAKQPKVTVNAASIQTKPISQTKARAMSVFDRLGPEKNVASVDDDGDGSDVVVGNVTRKHAFVSSTRGNSLTTRKRVVLAPTMTKASSGIVTKIIKKRVAPKISIKTLTSTTRKAPTTSEGIMVGERSSNVGSIYSRLGNKVAASKITLGSAKVASKTASVFNRLGRVIDV